MSPNPTATVVTIAVNFEVFTPTWPDRQFRFGPTQVADRVLNHTHESKPPACTLSSSETPIDIIWRQLQLIPLIRQIYVLGVAIVPEDDPMSVSSNFRMPRKLQSQRRQ